MLLGFPSRPSTAWWNWMQWWTGREIKPPGPIFLIFVANKRLVRMPQIHIWFVSCCHFLDSTNHSWSQNLLDACIQAMENDSSQIVQIFPTSKRVQLSCLVKKAMHAPLLAMAVNQRQPKNRMDSCSARTDSFSSQQIALCLTEKSLTRDRLVSLAGWKVKSSVHTCSQAFPACRFWSLLLCHYGLRAYPVHTCIVLAIQEAVSGDFTWKSWSWTWCGSTCLWTQQGKDKLKR